MRVKAGIHCDNAVGVFDDVAALCWWCIVPIDPCDTYKIAEGE